MPTTKKTTPKRAGNTQRLDETPSSPVLVKATIVKKKEELAKNKGGRPSSYSQELANEICQRIMAGRPLSKVCHDDDMPSRDTVHRWLIVHEEFSDKYVRACAIRREYRFETLEDVVDKEEDPARARIKVDVIKWQLSKEEPKKYGDKLDLTSDGKQMPTPIISIAAAPSQEQLNG